MNIIQIAGRLGRDPETRYTASGQKVTSFTMATNIRKGGKEETQWWRITIWGDRFDKMLTYLKKGSAVIVVGELRAEIYTDKEGRPQISLDVTADIIKFSPFGSPDRPAEGTAAGQAAHPAASRAQVGAGNEPGFGEGGGFSSMQSTYGQASTAYQPDAGEEQLPF